MEGSHVLRVQNLSRIRWLTRCEHGSACKKIGMVKIVTQGSNAARRPRLSLSFVKFTTFRGRIGGHKLVRTRSPAQPNLWLTFDAIIVTDVAVPIDIGNDMFQSEWLPWCAFQNSCRIIPRVAAFFIRQCGKCLVKHLPIPHFAAVDSFGSSACARL